MKEYIILFAVIFVVGVVLPWAYTSFSAPSLVSNHIMKATYHENVVFTLTSNIDVLNVSRVGDSRLKRSTELPDLYLSSKEGILSVEVTGAWDTSAMRRVNAEVDAAELYLIEKVKREKVSLSIRILPEGEADIEAYIGEKLVYKSKTNIMEEAKQFGLELKSLEDLLKERRTLVTGVFLKYVVVQGERIGYWELDEHISNRIDKGYIIKANFSIDKIEKGELILKWSSEEIGREKRAYFEIELSEIKEIEKGYPYFLLRASYKYNPVPLENNRLEFSCMNKTHFDILKEILDTYYKFFLGGGSSELRNYTGMVPGLWAQDHMLDCEILGCSLTVRSSAEIIEAKRAYIMPYVKDARDEKIDLKEESELKDKIWLSTLASWLVNSLMVFILLSIAIWLIKRAR